MKVSNKAASIIIIIIIAIVIIYLESLRVAPPEQELADESYLLAPEFTDIDTWLNSEPLTMEGLRGNVVLIDIWTYSCINCIRTLPYITAWHDKYKDQGLVIIGVHTPEFAFEKDPENVQKAMERHGVEYPVALDNNYGTWTAYRNRYWPRKYLIDTEGKIRYDHAGEGAYEETEKIIQELLAERNQEIASQETTTPEDIVEVDHQGIFTPEIYFGSRFFRGNIGNVEVLQSGVEEYIIPLNIEINNAYLGGTWNTTMDYSELLSEEGTVLLTYAAKAVNIVAGADEPVRIEVRLKGELVGDAAGSDVIDNIVTVQEEKLYNIVDAEEYDIDVLSMRILDPGLELYTFTFG